jgi:hypothetical protein
VRSVHRVAVFAEVSITVATERWRTGGPFLWQTGNASLPPMPRPRLLTRFGRAAVVLLMIAGGAFLVWGGRELVVLIELVSAPPVAPRQLATPPSPAQPRTGSRADEAPPIRAARCGPFLLARC